MNVIRPWAAATLIATSAFLAAGCAGIASVSSDVSSYGEWPADRKPGTYAFERLPSQQARPEETAQLEEAARGALAKAGFTPAAADKQPDVLVQVGARDARADVQLWDDPLWWRGGFGYWRHGPWLYPRWGVGATWRSDFPRYERQVALLIRDRASGKPMFETRAVSEGGTRADSATLGAMFQASMMDFPRLGMNPRRVVVQAGTAS